MTSALAEPRFDSQEAFRLFRREDRPVRELPPRPRYATTPFVKFVNPTAPPPEPEAADRTAMRSQFAALGLRVAVLPYPTSEGPHWNAYLLWPDGSLDNRHEEVRRRRFAVSLDNGAWWHIGAMDQERPLSELANYLRGCELANPISEGEGESDGPEKSTSPDSSAIPVTDLAEVSASPIECGSDSPSLLQPDRLTQLADGLGDQAAEFARRCASRGVEFDFPRPPTLIDGWDTGSRSARYRGIEMLVWLRQGHVWIDHGFTRWSLDAAIEHIEGRLGSRVEGREEEVSGAGCQVSGNETSTAPSLAAQLSPLNPEPVALPPASLELPPARRFRAIKPIPRMGGVIAAGTLLSLVALHPPRTVTLARPDRVWGEREQIPIGERGTFRTADGRRVCDYPIDALQEMAS